MNYHQARLKARAAKRRAKFRALKTRGYTLQEIGDMHNLSRERVRQILKVGGDQ